MELLFSLFTFLPDFQEMVISEKKKRLKHVAK